MSKHTEALQLRGPWSLSTSRAFWEGFAPAALPTGGAADGALRTTFRVEADWSRAEATVTQEPSGRGDDPSAGAATIEVSGSGDLHAAAAQVARFLSLDVDATGWPEVGHRDPVIARAQEALPGLRPCGFHSPYEAAAWAVLSQRVRTTQAAVLRAGLTARHGDDGAFPAPERLRVADVDLPGRKAEYLRAVADAALEGVLDAAALRALDPDVALSRVQQVQGLGPFAAELVVLRGANTPDVLPRNEARFEAEVAEQYGAGATVDDVAAAWAPYRTWAVVHLRALREQRGRQSGPPRRPRP